MFAADAQTLLRADSARVRKPLLAKKNIFELDHSRIGKKQRRVLVRNQRRAFNDGVASFSKEVQKGFANFVSGHLSFNRLLRKSVADQKLFGRCILAAARKPQRGEGFLER